MRIRCSIQTYFVYESHSLKMILFYFQPKDGHNGMKSDMEKLIGCLYDNMTECVYLHPINSFTVETRSQEVFEVDILGKGRAALEVANDELGRRRLW